MAEASDGREAVRQALALQPDVVVLDIGMPLLNGIEATRQIARRFPAISMLILSMHSDEAYITQAMKAGARGISAQGLGRHGADSGGRRRGRRQVVLQPGGGQGDARRLRPAPGRQGASSIATNRCPSASGKSSS